MTSQEVMAKLQAPFDPKDVEWRVDRGQKTTAGNYVFVLAYITNRAIQARLDEAFGPFGWKNEFKEWKGSSQICGISVWDNTGCPGGQWITKWDGSDDSNMDAVKGGLSGAMKRAAVQWGIGRYLYGLEQNRVPLKQNGEHWTSVKVSKKGQPDEYITGYWDTPKLPDWALPPGTKQNSPNSSQTTVRGQGGTNTSTQAQPPTTGQNKAAGSQGKDEPVIYCSECTLAITENAKAVKTFSEKKFGKILCRDCQAKAKPA